MPDFTALAPIQSFPMPSLYDVKPHSEPIAASKRDSLFSEFDDIKDPTYALVEAFARSSDFLAAELRRLGDEQAIRAGALADLTAVALLLKRERDYGQSPYDWNATIELAPKSPAASSGPGDLPITKMSVWDVLQIYGICKSGDAQPATEAALEKLIDTVEAKVTAARSVSDKDMLDIKTMSGNRDREITLSMHLLKQLADLLAAIVNSGRR
jgi:hypothetical protein